MEKAGLSQESVYRAYSALWLMGERFDATAVPGAGLDIGLDGGLGGRLVVATGLGSVTAGGLGPGAEVALGATLAGAAFLCIESQAALVKQAMQAGCCDFMVNNLDEALRVLKNEVRKRRPVSVGLVGDAATVLAEMVERGVLPDVLTDTASTAASPTGATAGVGRLQRLGSVVMDFGAGSEGTAAPQVVNAAEMLAGWSSLMDFRAIGVQAPDAQTLKHLDALALEALPTEDRMRRRWLQQAPKYFRRSATHLRVMWMKAVEVETLRRALGEGTAVRLVEQAPVP